MVKKVAFHTLGCKVNQAESEAMKTLFQSRGYQVVDFNEPADVYVINTCTVTHLADRKSRQMIRQARRRNPDAVVAAVGCYVQANREEVAKHTDVDLLIGTEKRQNLVDLVEKAGKEQRLINAVGDIMAAKEFEELPLDFPATRTRAFLKIQEGCNQFCTYCIIPYTRGPIRSLPLEKVLQAAEVYVAKGYKEIVLTGIHIGLYGTDLSGDLTLVQAVEGLLAVPGLERLRISSIEPEEVTQELLALMAGSSKICPHLHIPLQSGSDRILAKMNRPYTTSDFCRVVNQARDLIPEIAISTDIIAGFPGEGEEEFAATIDFVRRQRFSRLHVFPYSPRRGTPAAAFKEQVTHQIKEERVRSLVKLGKELSLAFHRQQVGKTLSVLVEYEPDREIGLLAGYSGNYIRVLFAGTNNLAGRIVQVLITEALEDVCWGIIS
jgi:threonylcarbamoyladenosine tRNA methylthiotransferase MtaB